MGITEENSWKDFRVFGGTERGTRKCFLTLVEVRSAEVLIRLITKWIKPGKIIMSDSWKAYNTINQQHQDQIKKQHNLNFKKPTKYN